MEPRVLKFTKGSIPKAASTVRSGGLLVYPTDTVYGLGCDPFSKDSVDRLFEAKRRDSKPVPVLCDSFESAVELVDLGPRGMTLAKEEWPGALTIVAPLRRGMPPPLHQNTGSLGVRVPGDPLCRELISACGGWLTGTSANVSGRGSSRSVSDAISQLGDSVDLYLDGGASTGVESTVVSVSGGKLIVLRQGRVGVKDEQDGNEPHRHVGKGSRGKGLG